MLEVCDYPAMGMQFQIGQVVRLRRIAQHVTYKGWEWNAVYISMGEIHTTCVTHHRLVCCAHGLWLLPAAALGVGYHLVLLEQSPWS